MVTGMLQGRKYSISKPSCHFGMERMDQKCVGFGHVFVVMEGFCSLLLGLCFGGKGSGLCEWLFVLGNAFCRVTDVETSSVLKVIPKEEMSQLHK